MKNFLSLFATAFLLSGVLFLTSCEEDGTTPGTGGNDDPPTVSITNVSETTVDGGTTITFTVTADKGTNDMSSLTVTEDGTNMGTDRYSITEFTDQSLTLNNPQLLTGNDVNNFVYEVNITVPAENLDPTMAADYVYTVVVADNKQNTDSDIVTVTVNASVDPTTPIDVELTAKLLTNQTNQNPVGALDLAEGKQSGVNSDGEVNREETEIRDLGLDCTVPAPGLNWRRQIGTTNGANMRAVDLAAVENFTFANVTTKDEIIGAYDSGIDLADGEAVSCSSGNTTDVTDVSDVVAADDMFVVLGSNGVYYLIRIDSVNETDADNDDFYEISIKY